MHYVFCRISQAHEASVRIAERVVGGDVRNAETGCDVSKLPIERKGLIVETEQAVRYSTPWISPVSFVKHDLRRLRPSRNRADHDNPGHADPLKTTQRVADTFQVLILRPGRANDDDIRFKFGK